MKVLHLPTSVAGQAFAISEAERAIGLDSNYLLVFKDKYYPDIPAMFEAPPNNVAEAMLFLPSILSKVWEIAGSDIDILHFNFTRSLLDYPGVFDLKDIGIYPQRIFVTANGCDVRLREPKLMYSPCSSHRCTSRVCWESDLKKKIRIDRWREVAHRIFVSTPDLLRSVPHAKFVPNTVYGWDKLKPLRREENDALTIVHAPTNRHIKGTGIIEEAVALLQEDYPRGIKLITIENKSREEALALYRQADVAIDQIRIGWYGVFAIECMKMGIPVIAYCRRDEMRWIPTEMRRDLGCSILNTTPSQIVGLLNALIRNRELLEIGRFYGQRFAERWHSPGYVAGLLKEEYTRDLP